MRIDRCSKCHRRLTRSTEANRKYWAILHALASELKVRGKLYGAESWHLLFKSRFLGCVDHVLPSGKIVSIPNSTASLDVTEFGAYLEKIEAFAAERDIFLDSEEEWAHG